MIFVYGLLSRSWTYSRRNFSVEGYKMFEQYISSGAPMDNFDGFELVSRFHAPETGEVLLLSRLIIT